MARRKRLDTTPEWKALKAHAAQMKTASLRDLFAADTARGQEFSLEVGGWYLDYSKNLATAETMRLLQALCPMADLRGEIDAMFSGRKINETENRPVLHVALRNRSNTPILVDRKDVMPAVNGVNANREASIEWAAANRPRFIGEAQAAVGARIARHIGEKGTANVRPEILAAMGLDKKGEGSK